MLNKSILSEKEAAIVQQNQSVQINNFKTDEDATKHGVIKRQKSSRLVETDSP